MTWRARWSHIANTLTLLAFCGAASVAPAADAPYPTRPIRLVVAFAPGGGLDALARIISPKLSAAMGQTWVVENRTGAAGNVGAEVVARAKPDGHTLLVALSNQLTVNPSLYSMPFSVEKDLQPVNMLASVEFVLVVHPSLEASR